MTSYEGGRWTAPPTSTLRTFLVAFAVAVFGSLLVAGATTLLGPRIESNAEAERQERLMALIRTVPGIEDLLAEVGNAEVGARVVDLRTGEFVDGADPESLDMRAARDDPALSGELPAARDLAQIGRRPDLARVFLLSRGGVLEMAILPVFGQGFGGTIWGYLGLAGDLNTFVGLTFYEHSETPGLGARIDDPAWKNQWIGKQVRDENGSVRIGVAKIAVSLDSPDAPFEVDAIVGATWTSSGVTALLRFWMGDDGYGPLVDTLLAGLSTQEAP